MVNVLKKVLLLVLPICLLAFVFTNCDSSEALNLIGPEVEIDLDGNVMYKAIDPNFTKACIEVRLPINIKPKALQTELVNYILANTNQISTFNLNSENFDVNKLEVSYGACPVENVDAMLANCAGKRINEIPVGHDFKVLTYGGLANLTIAGLSNLPINLPNTSIVEIFCNQF